MVAERYDNSSEAASTRAGQNGAESEPRLLRWTVDEFHRAGDAGVFEGRHVELIEGEIFAMTAMGSRHVTSVLKAARVLERAFGEGFHVRPQMPLVLGAGTDPEPDIAVVRGALEDYVAQHPTAAETLLVIEVSDTTLERDRAFKASLYASAGIADYWVLDVTNRRLEVRRAPRPMTGTPFIAGYEKTLVYEDKSSVAPLGAPQSSVRVADLLP